MFDYRELCDHLCRAKRHGVKLGLDRVRVVRERLGRPDEAIPVTVQVGGTNGKGSTSAFIASILEAAGQRTGLYTSPHLIRFAERFVVDGEPLADAAILAAGREVLAADPEDTLTFFEQVTLIAAVAFRAQGVDAAVFEVGLGGRLDATTALKADVAVVSGVALDHEAILGNTLAAIAEEKAGIFRAGRPAILGQGGDPAALPVLRAAADRASAAPIVLASETTALPEVLGLRGAHQQANARAAVLAIAHLPGLRVSAQARAAGLAHARIAGRLEQVGDVLLDGAHNPAGAEALARALDELLLPRPRHWVFGVSSDKDVRGMLRALLPAVDGVFVTAARSTRSASPADLAAAVKAVAPAMPVAAHAQVANAIAAARQGAGSVIVAGSLFLVGEARAWLTCAALDDFDVQDPAPIR